MTRTLRRFMALPSSDRWLLVRAAAAVAGARIALWVLPFRWVHVLVRHPEIAAVLPDAGLADRMAWAVRVVSSRIPMATCLTQALALQRLLARAGQPATLRIGVQRGSARGFESHAWVEEGGRILIGGAGEEDRFVSFLALPGDRP